MDKTDNDLIFIEHYTPYSRDEIDKKIALVSSAMKDGGNLREAIAAVVPTYQSEMKANQINLIPNK